MNDKQMLEQAIENAKEVVNRLEEQHKELYGYKDSDLVYLERIIKDSKNKGLTVREIRRKSRLFGSIPTSQVEDAANSLVDSDELKVLTTKNVRGLPRVAYVAKEFSSI